MSQRNVAAKVYISHRSIQFGGNGRGMKCRAIRNVFGTKCRGSKNRGTKKTAPGISIHHQVHILISMGLFCGYYEGVF